MSSKNSMTTEQEADRILAMYGRDAAAVPRIMELLERQFVILHNRAQVLLTLCGVVVTVTGFSGRIIAGTNRLAQVLIIGGVTLSLAAAITVVRGVLHLWWLTQHPGELPGPWVIHCLSYRDRKTRAYRVAILMLIVGLCLYVGAIAIMLLFPKIDTLPMIR
jgi:hypothetical protein